MEPKCAIRVSIDAIRFLKHPGFTWDHLISFRVVVLIFHFHAQRWLDSFSLTHLSPMCHIHSHCDGGIWIFHFRLDEPIYFGKHRFQNFRRYLGILLI